MKIFISKELPTNDSYAHVSDLGLLDLVVEDSEATEIIVDNFLSKFAFEEIGNVVQKIASKLRKNGKITFYHAEIDMICYQRSRSMIDIDTLNKTLFSQGEMRSVFPIENLVDLLTSVGLSIKSKQLHNSCQAIVTATR